MHPNPKKMPVISKNEFFDLFIIFKKGININNLNTEIKLICYDSAINNQLVFKADLNKNNCIIDPSVY